ncbi:SDR family NAD(P)-dependent oxidoreductase [Chloroflexota bacterium]
MQSGELSPDYYTELVSLFSLEARVALVTGGAQGIGRAICLAFASAGAAVVLADLKSQELKEVEAEIHSLGGQASSVVGDVTNPDDVQRMVETTTHRYGPVDVLVNSAGTGRESTPPQDLPLALWERILAVNLTGTFLMCQAVGRTMMKQRSGSVINLASISGLVTNKGRHVTAYVASKGGVVMLTKALAAEWAPWGVRVNTIAPGYVETPLTESALADPVILAGMVDMIPMHRIAKPIDIVGAAVYLASDASAYVTGHTLVVDGGLTAW